MLITEELREKSSRCKSFRFRTYEEGLEVLIMKGLREQVFGSADSKGVRGRIQSGEGGVPVIHGRLYHRSR